MNNVFYNAPSPDAGQANKKAFRHAQNNVAYVMFIMLFTYIACSVVLTFVLLGAKNLQSDTFRYELTQAVLYTAYMGTPLLLCGLVSGKGPGSYFNFRKGKKNTVLTGLFALGVMYFAQLVAVLTSMLFESTAGIDINAAGLTETADVPVLILRVVYIAVFPAILEEMLTRGFVLHELLPYGRSFAVVISALVFAMMHMNPVQLPFAFISGCVMAHAVISCGSLRVSVAVHFINNLLSVLFTSLPSFVGAYATFVTEACVSALIFTGGIVSAVYLLRHEKKEATAEKNNIVVDLSGGISGNIVPAMYAYIGITWLTSVVTLFTLGAM